MPARIGAWLVDWDARTLSRGDVERRISPKAAAVLRVLAEARGEVVSRARLMDAVWPRVTVGEEVLTHAVVELRKALGPDHVGTVHKNGYRLIQPASARTRPAASSLDALTSYVSAQSLFEDGGSRSRVEAARLFREAIRLDPDFAPARAGLAITLVKLHHYYGGPKSYIAEAAQQAEQAITLAPGTAEGYAAYGMALSAAGALDRAMEQFSVALQARPEASEPYRLMARVLFVNGAYEAAVAACERAARLRPTEFQCIMMGAKALRALGRDAAATSWTNWARKRVDQRLAENPNDLRALCNLVSCQIDAGEHEDALSLLGRLLGERDGMIYYAIGALARAGEARLALETLEAVADYGWAHAAYLAHDVDLAPIRQHSRYRRIAGGMAAR